MYYHEDEIKVKSRFKSNSSTRIEKRTTDKQLTKKKKDDLIKKIKDWYNKKVKNIE